jgi:DNA-binding NarL/FixJ family response regulator
MGMATELAGAKPSREEVEGALPSPATSEEIARAIREAFAGNPPLKRQRSALKKAKQ